MGKHRKESDRCVRAVFRGVERLEPRLLLSATFTQEVAAGSGDGGFADFDNDGWTDMLSGASVAYNQGTSNPGGFGGLQPLPSQAHGPATAGDFDNDGFLDIYSYGDHMLFRNINGTSFQDVSHMLPTIPNPNSRGAAFADVNGDGFVDLYVGGYESWPSAYHPDTLLINEGGTGFSLAWTQSNDAQVTGGDQRSIRPRCRSRTRPTVPCRSRRATRATARSFA